jgi:hypothetical protein
VKSLLRRKRGREELKRVARAERGNERVKAALLLADRQAERPLEVWVRVHLGGERRVDVARACGYKDGSAITQILKRLGNEPSMAARKSGLQAEFDSILSGVKR